ISPYLFYDDLKAALSWLEKAFGLEMAFTLPDPHGSIMHAEMKLYDGIIMMGPTNDEQNSKSPATLGGIHQSLYIYVDDVDAHHNQAKAAGATILFEPADQFWRDRMYSAHDMEGQQWTFAQHVKDIAAEDMKPDQ
ncbi:MAG: VOC family protein, partial [Gammaproteobacteria bacterium]|nr:VOC family protein [Gammaproteobacteria bacterium]